MGPASESRHFRIERLADGVYAAFARPGGFALSNSAIVDLGGATVVFDSTLTPMAGAALRRAAERLTGTAPSFVVNSHWHGDHHWGNSAFVGAHVVSTRRVREVILKKSRPLFRSWRRELPKELASLRDPGPGVDRRDVPELRGWFRGVLATPATFPIVPPQVTFDDELVLTGRRRSVQLLSYGGGHSPSDVFAFLPDERIIVTGDLALVGYHLSVGDGYPAEWIRILGRMLRLRADRVVPGHGALGDARTLARSREYLRDLVRRAADARRRAVPLRVFRRSAVPERYREWRFSLMYPDNLVRAYRLGATGAG